MGATVAHWVKRVVRWLPRLSVEKEPDDSVVEFDETARKFKTHKVRAWKVTLHWPAT